MSLKKCFSPGEVSDERFLLSPCELHSLSAGCWGVFFVSLVCTWWGKARATKPPFPSPSASRRMCLMADLLRVSHLEDHHPKTAPTLRSDRLTLM